MGKYILPHVNSSVMLELCATQSHPTRWAIVVYFYLAVGGSLYIMAEWRHLPSLWHVPKGWKRGFIVSGALALLIAFAGIRPDRVIIVAVSLGILACMAIGFSDYLQQTHRNIPGFFLVMLLGASMVGLAAWHVWPQPSAPSPPTEEVRPHLSGRVEQTFLGDAPSPGVGGAMALFLITITNTGEPSSAEGFWANIESPNYKDVIQSHKFPPTMILQLRHNKTAIFHESDDALYEKTIHPISPGAPVRGWLRYDLPGKNVEDLKTYHWTIHMQDYKGNYYEISYDYSKCPGCKPQYYPGANQPFPSDEYDSNGKEKMP